MYIYQVYVYTFINALICHTYILWHIHTSAGIHTQCTHKHTHAHAHTMRTRTRTYTQTHAYTQTYTYCDTVIFRTAYIHNARTNTHTHTHTHTHNAHTHKHTHTNTHILRHCHISHGIHTQCMQLNITKILCDTVILNFNGSKGDLCAMHSWRQRLIGCVKLQVIFHKRATNYRALLQKMTYTDKASFDSTPPCTCCYTFVPLCIHMRMCVYMHLYVYVSMYIYVFMDREVIFAWCMHAIIHACVHIYI